METLWLEQTTKCKKKLSQKMLVNGQQTRIETQSTHLKNTVLKLNPHNNSKKNPPVT